MHGNLSQKLALIVISLLWGRETSFLFPIMLETRVCLNSDVGLSRLDVGMDFGRSG